MYVYWPEGALAGLVAGLFIAQSLDLVEGALTSGVLQGTIRIGCWIREMLHCRYRGSNAVPFNA